MNVGCIPKKLFHIGSQVNEVSHLRPRYGWNSGPETDIHTWSTLTHNVQNYIKSINFGYKTKMQEVGVDFINSFAEFEN